MAQEYHDYDPRGLIGEAYRIDGISDGEVRAIFLDWALTRPDTPSVKEQIAALLAAYAADEPADHPMTLVLHAGLEASAPGQGRRGGSRGRRGG